MGGLSSGPGPGLCLLTLVVLILAQKARSAPVQEENALPQSRAQGYYDGISSEISTGCYYNFQHYGEGDRIITNEPCLNCTCHNRMLMCYLRVCPFTKAIGQNCTIEKKPGQCCPLIICPEVPVQLLTSSTTTEHSESVPHRNQLGYGQYGTAIGHLDDYGCKINGEFYTNGAQIPGNIDKPCEVCYCIRNRTACIMQECTLQVEGCIPVYEEGLCCPVRYQCDYEYNYNAITTEQPRPTPGLVLTTTTSGPFECQHDNKWYADGAMVDTEDPCEHCYCMKGDIVCAVQECKPPFEKDGHNCTAMPPAPGKCCPDSYHCDGNEIVDESEPTFRQDRMHKFGRNNANVTMSITSSTSNSDKHHGWHYGISSNENETPNRFTDEHDKDGTAKPGKPVYDSEMMVTEGAPPTVGPLESGSHHIDGHGGGLGTRPLESEAGLGPMEKPSTSQGHGVNTDNMLTISQVIQSIVQNQTNFLNQNKLDQTGKPQKKPSQHDDKITFPSEHDLAKKPGMELHAGEDGNPIEADSGTTDFPDEYYGFTGGVTNIYSEHGGRPQKRPVVHKQPGIGEGTQDSTGKPTQILGGHKQPGMAVGTSEGQEKPSIHRRPGMDGTPVVMEEEGNPVETYEGMTEISELSTDRPGSTGIYGVYDELGRPQKRPGTGESVTGVYGQGFTGKPDGDGLYSTFDEYGRPQKRPVIHKQPGGEAESVTESQDFTGKPGAAKEPEIFGEHGHVGRPHKRPVIHKRPGATDDESAAGIQEGGVTGYPEVFTGKPISGEHGHPGSEVMTDEDGNVIEGSTGRPGVDEFSILYTGRPQKIPGDQKKPGSEMDGEGMTGEYETVTEVVEGYTGLPGIHTIYGDRGHTGRPATRPTVDNKPELDGSQITSDGHGKPFEGEGEYVYYDTYGRPHKRPIVPSRPGITGSETEGLIHDPSGGDKHSPHKKPQIHIKPSVMGEGHLTDENGNPVEGVSASPDTDQMEIFYDKYGRPHKRPVTHKQPGEAVATDEYAKPVHGVGVTDYPEGITGQPGADGDQQIFYDEHGRPHKRPVTHMKPGGTTMTDEHGQPVSGTGVTDFPEGFTGKPDGEEQQIFYDGQGRPYKRPVTHKKPGETTLTDEHGEPAEEVEVTESPLGHTGKPEDDSQLVFYDQHGRPLKRPVVQKKPGEIATPGEHDKPVYGAGVTDFPGSLAGTPENDGDLQIFYDEHGRPHKRPVTHKQPGEAVATDEHAKPVHGVGVTDYPEGVTGQPGADGDQQIFYDVHGRPHKRPVTHTKPGGTTMTDEHGEPVEVEGVTDSLEGITGKPETDSQSVLYDDLGRPHKRPIVQKKPEGVMTDGTGVTDFPEGASGKPGTGGDQQIFYDEHGRPHKRPVTHKEPQGVTSDEHGKPGYEVSVTDLPEGLTGKPEIDINQQTFYDEHGRPLKRPVIHNKPGADGAEVLTDDHEKPAKGSAGSLETQTEQPEQDEISEIYGGHGVIGKPHKKPGQTIPGPEGVQVVTDDALGSAWDSESVTGQHEKEPSTSEDEEETSVGPSQAGLPVTGLKPGAEHEQKPTEEAPTQVPDIYGEHGHAGRPQKRPVTQKRPGMAEGEGAETEVYEGMTETPEGYTGKPGSDDEPSIYGEHGHSGRPHKRPANHSKPGTDGSQVMTDEQGEPMEAHTGKPESDVHSTYDEHGRPIKRPAIHTKPGESITTDGQEKPFDPTTELPETGSQQVYYDQYGRPHKRPVTEKIPGEAALTDEQEKPIFTDSPESDSQLVFYDQFGRPHKRPVTHTKPEEHEGVTESPEGTTEKPGTDDQQILYDEHGRPFKRPFVQKKPGESVMTHEMGVTDFPESLAGTPENDGDLQIFYDEHGRPHKRPVTHKQPGEAVATDEHAKPVHGVGVTDYPEGITGQPGADGDQQIFYDEHGRPHKRPVTHMKPGGTTMTDEHGQPVSGTGVTDFPEGFTGKPDGEEQQIFYDGQGRPYKRPVTHKKPGETTLTDEHGEPVEVEGVTESLEGLTGKPESDSQAVFYDDLGRPHKRPVVHSKPGTDGVTENVLLEGVSHQGLPDNIGVHGHTDRPEMTSSLDKGSGADMSESGTKDDENITKQPNEGFTDQPGVEQTTFGEAERPQKRPHDKPGTNEDGLEGTIALPGDHTDHPSTDDLKLPYDENGLPVKRPVIQKLPVGTDDVLEGGSPTDSYHGMTETPDGFSTYPIFGEHGHAGRPQKRPVGQKPSDTTDTEEDVPTEATTGSTEDGAEMFYDVHGRPHKKPVVSKEPGSGDEAGSPNIEITKEPGHGQTFKPDGDEMEIFYDKYGRPHKRPSTQKKPDVEEAQVTTDESTQPVEKDTVEVPEEQTAPSGSDGTGQSGLIHEKPTSDDNNNEDGQPIEESPEEQTKKPESDGLEHDQDQDSVPEKRPISHEKPGIEGITETAEEHAETPETDTQFVVFDQFGRPHKRPVATHQKPGEQVLTDDHKKPSQEEAEFPAAETGKKPEYDEHGHPGGSQKKPADGEKPGMHGEDTTTEEGESPIEMGTGSPESESETSEPDKEETEIFYDKYGRPHKRPVTHKKPGEASVTDEHGRPVEGVEAMTESTDYTGKPEGDGQQVLYGEHDRPYKRPVTHKKPGDSATSVDKGKPFEEHDATTESQEGLTGKPDGDSQHHYDHPYKRPIVHKQPDSDNEVTTDEGWKPEEQDVTGEKGESAEEHEGVTEISQGLTGKPGSEEDQHGRPHKDPVSQKKPESAAIDEPGQEMEEHEGMTETAVKEVSMSGSDMLSAHDEHGHPIKKPVLPEKPEGHDILTESPESSTGRPESDSQLVFYDQFGRPHKRPVTHTKPEEHEGVTESPEGTTERPGTDDQQILYDEHGRPFKRPVIHKKPDMSGAEVLTDEHGKPVEGVTGSPEEQTQEPEHDGKPEIYGDHGLTVMPHMKPGQFIPGPEGIEITEEKEKPAEVAEGTTEAPERFTGKPETDDDQTLYGEKPAGVTTDEHGKPLETASESSEEHTKEPEHEVIPEVHGEHDGNNRPNETPITHGFQDPTGEHEKPIHAVLPEDHVGKPEHEGTPQVYDGEEPSGHKQPGTEGDKVESVHGTTETLEGFTGRPGTADEPVIFGDHSHTGRPHKRPVKPTIPETDGSQEVPEASEGKPEAQPAFDEQGLPVEEPSGHKGQETSEDHLTADAERPEIDTDGAATKAPEEAIIDDTDQHVQKKPDVEDVHATDGMTAAPEEEATGVYDQHPQQKPVHELQKETETDSGKKKPETQTPEEGLAEKPKPDSTEVNYDESGRPQMKPAHTVPTVTSDTEVYNEVPEDGSTGIPGTFGEQDHPEKRPTSSDGEHVPEEIFTEKPGMQERPDAADTQEKKPALGGEEPVESGNVSEPEKADEPAVKPGSGHVPGVTIDETEPERGVTNKPEVGEPGTINEEMGLKPAKRPVAQDGAFESTTKISSVTEHDTNGHYDGHVPVAHRPEENEIFAVPEKGVTGTGESSTKLPSGILDVFGEPDQPQKKPTIAGQGTEIDQTGILEKDKLPEGGQRPSTDDVATSEEEDDESLIITTDESEEDLAETPEGGQIHKKPDSEIEEKPFDSKVPSGLTPDHTHSGSTPGLGSSSYDLTTPGYGTHDASGAPVTEAGGTVHPSSDKLGEHVSGVVVGHDEEDKLEKVTTPEGEEPVLGHAGESLTTPGYGVTSKDKEHGKPDSEAGEPAVTESIPAGENDGDKPQVPGVDLTHGTPAEPSHVSVDGTHPDITPTQETDGMTSLGENAGLVTGKPESTPEGTHGVPELIGSVPSGEKTSTAVPSTEAADKVSGIKPTPGRLPQIPVAYLPPEVDSSTQGPILIDEGLHESSAPFDEVLNNLANILRPSQTTEESAGTTEAHGDVPGEGSCFMDGVTYPDNSDVPPLSPCHTKCTCISSIIHCLSLKCPPPPEDVSQCTVVHEENSCCPIYVCGTDVSPTFPVANHEKETSTDPSADKNEPATTQDDELLKPIKPMRGSTTGKPEFAGSEEDSRTTEGMPTKHDAADEIFEKPKPGTITEPVKSQHGGEMPVESDKGAPTTAKPETSQDKAQTAQESDHSASSKPEPENDQAPTKVSEGETTPEEPSHVKPVSNYYPVSSDSEHPSTVLPTYFGTGKPGYPVRPQPETGDHVIVTDRPGHEEAEEHSAATEEGVQPDKEKEKPMETGDHGLEDDFVEPTTYRPTHHGTGKPASPLEGSHQKDKQPVEDVPSQTSTEKSSDAEEAVESEKPEQTETETQHKPDVLVDHAETGADSTPAEEESDKGPEEQSQETNASKGKPQQSGLGDATGEESEHPTTEKTEGEKPPIRGGAAPQDEESVKITSRPHEKPETDDMPTHEDGKPVQTTTKPHEVESGTKLPFSKPESIGEATGQSEKDFVQQSSQEPEPQNYDSSTTYSSEESETSSKQPIVDEKPSGEGEDQNHADSFSTNRPTEEISLQTKKPEQTIASVGGTLESRPDSDDASTDKIQLGDIRPTEDSAVEDQKPHEKPDDSSDRPDEGLDYSTGHPIDQFGGGKPLAPPKGADDTQKKPQIGQDSEEPGYVTSEGPHDLESEKPYGEGEEPHKGAETDVHPAAVDEESAPGAMVPHEKPETDGHPIDGGVETKPSEEPSKFDELHKRPEAGEGSDEKPEEEGSTAEKPVASVISKKPSHGEKVPQTGQDTEMAHSTTETLMTDGKPGETEPQHGQTLSSAIKPKPTGFQGVAGQDKPQTDDIPEEILLHPTRMPGTYETEKPGLEPDAEEDALPDHRPDIDDETMATIFPEGFIRPITKRPVFGTGKPGVSDEKESTTPGHPLIHHRPQIDQTTDVPQEMFGVTGKPIFDIITDAPEDFTALFGIKPSTVYGQQPDKDGKPEHITQVYVPDSTTRLPGHKPTITEQVKRPIHTTNGTHFIQYVPYKDGEMPHVPEGAKLGEPQVRPNGDKYWPIIYMKPVTTTPGTDVPQEPFKPIPQQVFNGTHFIQYLPYNDAEEPVVPEGATLGQPQKGPDGQIYWPIIADKPVISPEDKPLTEQPYPGQVYNGTHFIQFVPVEEGREPEVPQDAVLGEPETAPSGQKFWPIISTKPIPEDESVDYQKPLHSQPQQIFNGTHFIQFAPYNDGQEPDIPEEAILGQPQKGPDGQIYWPIINMKPLPAIPEKLEPTTHQPFPPAQVFNGTNFIQYVPFKDGEVPEVPEGATLGQPQKSPDGQIYWPIIYMRPRPVTPQGSFPEQIYNGTNFIQYVPYKDGEKPEIPTHATLGQPQKAPDGQMYWPIIYMKPVTYKPEEELATEEPFQTQIFNGTHFIQYIPYSEGFEPDIPEEATLGKPEKKPNGQTYWPIIYQKLPTTPEPETVQQIPGQVFNGTHFIQYVPYRPGHKPVVPEGVTVGRPQKGPDGQMYWKIVSTKPLPAAEDSPVEPQFFNGTHFIQYLPFEEGKKPEIPEGATLGKPETGLAGQRFWPVIYMKPLSGVPITHQKPLDLEQPPNLDASKGQVFNGTHYIQYLPYKPGKRPDVPEGGTLGHPTKRPDGQIYWPVVYLRPVPGVPFAPEHQVPMLDPIKGPIFNGTHYVQYVPYVQGQRPQLPEGATLGHPTKRPDGQMYWPIIYLRPVQGSTLWSPYDYFKPQPEQVYNGTHFIQYLPYNPTRMPEVPEGATLGQPQRGPGGQMYWVIISDKPLPPQTFNGTHVVQYVTPVTPEQEKPQAGDHIRPIQVFNGSHYIQYVPYTPGQKPVVPEGATLGHPTKGPEGQMYWPIIYMKPRPGTQIQQAPMQWTPGQDYSVPQDGQIFNGTHYILFVPYDPSTKPTVPEGATINEPQRRPDGQMYWMITSRKPLPDLQKPFQQHSGQIFNGTHYIQYIPYNSSQMPQVPEGAILGHPQKGPEGQMFWVIISDKPLPAQPGTQYVQYVTPVTPEDDQVIPGPMFNGTHYIQYVPYKHAQVPKIPQEAVLGELHKGPGGQLYWPIIYRGPPHGMHFNGTHYIQYPDNATVTDANRPGEGTSYLQPLNATSKPAEDHPFWSYGQYAPRPGNGTHASTNRYPSHKPGNEEHAFWTYGHDKPQNGSEDDYGYKPTTEFPSWPSGQIQNATRIPEVPKLPSGQYGGSDHSKPGYEYESGYYKPEKPERPSTPEDSYEAIDEDHLIEYPSGSDYDETQEQPYGPGTCRYAGKVYVSAQQIPRDDPCDFCFCFRSDIICLQQSCPPPIPGCHEEPIQGFCCPRYECHVRMATLLNVTSTTTTTTTTLPPHFLSHVYKGAAGRTGCFIQGKAYRVGQAIPSASGPCMDCICGGDGKMKCEPKVCTPEPMVRQMMVSSEKSTAANHR